MAAVAGKTIGESLVPEREGARMAATQWKALFRDADRRLDQRREVEVPPPFARELEASDEAGRRNRQPTPPRRVLGNAFRDVHVARSRGRRRFSGIDGEHLTAREPDQQEAAAADSGVVRVAHRQREGDRDRRVDRISTGAQDGGTGPARINLRGNHHALRAYDGRWCGAKGRICECEKSEDEELQRTLPVAE